jgi:phage portal protein BeeE
MQIYKQLATPDFALPWEEGRLSPEDKKKLGRFRKPLLQLLHREPSQRATALQFCKQMFEIFSSTAGGTAVSRDAMPVRW